MGHTIVLGKNENIVNDTNNWEGGEGGGSSEAVVPVTYTTALQKGSSFPQFSPKPQPVSGGLRSLRSASGLEDAECYSFFWVNRATGSCPFGYYDYTGSESPTNFDVLRSPGRDQHVTKELGAESTVTVRKVAPAGRTRSPLAVNSPTAGGVPVLKAATGGVTRAPPQRTSNWMQLPIALLGPKAALVSLMMAGGSTRNIGGTSATLRLPLGFSQANTALSLPLLPQGQVSTATTTGVVYGANFRSPSMRSAPCAIQSVRSNNNMLLAAPLQYPLPVSAIVVRRSSQLTPMRSSVVLSGVSAAPTPSNAMVTYAYNILNGVVLLHPLDMMAQRSLTTTPAIVLAAATQRGNGDPVQGAPIAQPAMAVRLRLCIARMPYNNNSSGTHRTSMRLGHDDAAQDMYGDMRLSRKDLLRSPVKVKSSDVSDTRCSGSRPRSRGSPRHSDKQFSPP